jgi:hypothetical protein
LSNRDSDDELAADISKSRIARRYTPDIITPSLLGQQFERQASTFMNPLPQPPDEAPAIGCRGAAKTALIGAALGSIVAAAPLLLALPFGTGEGRAWAPLVISALASTGAVVGAIIGAIIGSLVGPRAVVKAFVTKGLYAGLIGIVGGFVVGCLLGGLVDGKWDLSRVVEAGVELALLGGWLGVGAGTVAGAWRASK